MKNLKNLENKLNYFAILSIYYVKDKLTYVNAISIYHKMYTYHYLKNGCAGKGTAQSYIRERSIYGGKKCEHCPDKQGSGGYR